MKQAAKRERRSQEKAIRLGDKHTIADTKSKSRPSLEEDIRHFEQQKQKRTDDFGDMGDLEAGEIDEEAEAFEKRLDRNKNLQSSKPTAAQRPGARDRRRARENGSKTNTDSSVARDQNSGKNFQPFKNFVEPPGVNGTSLNRPRSLSRSPPPAKRRRDARQPSPVPMDSPASSKSVKKWKEKRAIYGKIQPGKSATANGGGGFASGSLLDRIERGTNSSDSRTPASRDPRNFDDRPPPTKYTPHAETGTGRYTPHAEPSSRRGGNPHYRGGYF